jgi:hypothetical protein
MPFDPNQFIFLECLSNKETGEVRVTYQYKFFFFVIKLFRDDGSGYSIKILRGKVNYRKFKQYWNTTESITDQTVIGCYERDCFKILYQYNEVLRL